MYILKLIGVGLLLISASILAPQLPYFLLRQLIHQKFRQTYNQKQLSDSIRYLKRKKFIAFEYKENKIKILLTKLGRKKLFEQQLSEITIKSTNWDGRWRVLTFDIPEQHRAARHFFRKKLKGMGFYHFQRSVFILPYPCEKEIDLLAKHLEIRPYVHVLTAARFANDKILVKKFHLA